MKKRKFKVGDKVTCYNPRVPRSEDNPWKGVIIRRSGRDIYHVEKDGGLSSWDECYMTLDQICESPLWKALE